MTTLTTGRHSTSTIAWRFTTCTSTNSSTERAHVVLFLAHFHHTHVWLKFEPCPHSTHNHHHGHPCGCCLFDLTSSFYLFAFLLSVFLSLFFHLSDEQQSELKTRRSWKTCATPPTTRVRAPTTSSTSPQVMSPTAMTSTSSRTHRSASPSRSLPRTRREDAH